MLVLAMSALPAAALDRQVIAHLLSGVDASQHHHHDASGAIVVDEDHHRDAPAGHTEGHEHLTVQAQPFDAPASTQLEGSVPSMVRLVNTFGRDLAPPEVASRPPSRPPRSA